MEGDTPTRMTIGEFVEKVSERYPGVLGNLRNPGDLNCQDNLEEFCLFYLALPYTRLEDLHQDSNDDLGNMDK